MCFSRGRVHQNRTFSAGSFDWNIRYGVLSLQLITRFSAFSPWGQGVKVGRWSPSWNWEYQFGEDVVRRICWCSDLFWSIATCVVPSKIWPPELSTHVFSSCCNGMANLAYRLSGWTSLWVSVVDLAGCQVISVEEFTEGCLKLLAWWFSPSVGA